jgi:hypothetical protein
MDTASEAALAEAGLRFIRAVDVAEPLIPPTLATFATSLETADLHSAESIMFDDPELWAEANAAWFRLARDGGLFGEDRRFLVAIRQAVDDSAPDFWWASVELLDSWDVIGKDGGAASGLLGPAANRPAFVMLSADGRVVLRVDSGETAVDLILVRDPERVALFREHGSWQATRPRTTDFRRAALQRWLAHSGVE